MQKLTKEQAAQLTKSPRGYLSPVYINILNLQVEEILHITSEDWGRKYPISRAIHGISKKHTRQYSLTHLANNQGYLISRIK